MYYIGIDPGISGAVAIITESQKIFTALTFKDFAAMESQLTAAPGGALAALEAVHSMPGQGVASTFTFGANWGHWQGLLQGLHIPYILVTPQRWQKTVLDFVPSKEAPRDKETESEGKARLARNKTAVKFGVVQFVKRRFPDAKDYIKFKKDWGIADALCLALYAHKVRLGGAAVEYLKRPYVVSDLESER